MNIPLESFENYLKNKNLSDRTIENYIYYFNKFDYDSFTLETVSKFMSQKSNRNLVARGFIKNFQKFLKLNYREFNISDESKNLINEVELPKMSGRTKQRVINPLSKEQIFLLEKQFDTEADKLKLIMSYFCGLRLGGLMNVRIIDFNWDEWKKDVSKVGECIVFEKGNKSRIAYVPSNLMKRIARFIRSSKFNSPDSHIFTTATGKIKTKNSGSSWQKALREAGIKSKITKIDNDGKPIIETVVHPHKLRHSFGYYLKNDKNMDIREIQELMGHSSIKSTQIYTQISKQKLKDSIKDAF